MVAKKKASASKEKDTESTSGDKIAEEVNNKSAQAFIDFYVSIEDPVRILFLSL